MEQEKMRQAQRANVGGSFRVVRDLRHASKTKSTRAS